MVDWAGLRHAYGSAEDVPGNVAALGSADEDERREAFGELYTSIIHQGNRYSASAAAVPLLLDLVAEPSTPERDLPLYLLGLIAVGPDAAWLPGGVRPGDLGDDEARAYEAVGAGLAVLRPLLADEELADSAAYILGWYPGDPESLRALATRDSPAAVVAIGLLGRPEGVPIAERAMTDDRPGMRWAGAVALARLRGAEAGAAVRDELLGWAASAREADHFVPYLEGDLAGYALLSLPLIGEDALEPALARLRQSTDVAALTAVEVALRAAFPAGPIAAGTPFTALTARQQRLVGVLAGHEPDLGNVSLAISDYGLPHGPERLTAYAHPAEPATHDGR
ncbi:hypothetical protein JIG36_01295 [Actinoplanes sp. LDG1-06]|uniref:HEAT repeat domain-containing protein n=1 Tax=Paractinoplanes ovalisporus TaxID=2810368 RepID=A0ABS2A2X2_9ACTN|nr:hypothetical protein [Actinoplanes ovalisporus]MBM2614190.1 hypothetical protein [Actinoplanes ovalisporus]